MLCINDQSNQLLKKSGASVCHSSEGFASLSAIFLSISISFTQEIVECMNIKNNE